MCVFCVLCSRVGAGGGRRGVEDDQNRLLTGILYLTISQLAAVHGRITAAVVVSVAVSFVDIPMLT